VLQARELRKSYGSRTAVDGVSFAIARGETLGLLGPNGAGKSTTILMAMGLLDPDSGDVELEGLGPPSAPAVRARMGIAPQSLALYPEMTAQENLRFFARIEGLSGRRLAERIAWSLELAGLEDRERDLVGTFSGGMQRRLNLACALVHEPLLVLLDEPTAGVDPQSRHHVFLALERLKSEGLSILYTTHSMEEAERLCDRVAILDAGRVLAVGTVPELLRAHGGVTTVEIELASGERLRIETADPAAELARLAREGVAWRSVEIRRATLESVFLALTGHALRD
jgi:ABC-2 type transport system ATP-binding protein